MLIRLSVYMIDSLDYENGDLDVSDIQMIKLREESSLISTKIISNPKTIIPFEVGDIMIIKDGNYIVRRCVRIFHEGINQIEYAYWVISVI